MRGIEENLSTDIHWKGTPGVGVFMFGLNVAHVHAYLLHKPVKLTIHWYWDVKNQYHFEDPELTIERMEYIHNFYQDKDMVEIDHVYDSVRGDVYANQTSKPTSLLLRSGYMARMSLINWWQFRNNCRLPVSPKKLVFWRDTFNADVVRPWKRLINHHQWDVMINQFYMHGFEPVELTYRTPISEAMYHINTSKFVICYDGLWHYVAKNFHKPLIVLSRSSITKLHTTECMMLDDTNYEHYVKNFNIHKRRDILFPKYNRTDRHHWPDKKLTVHGDGLHQLKSRINLYKKTLNEKLHEVKNIISR